MGKDSERLSRALWELGDHFSRLGGAARYLGMSESELPLYIVLRLMQRQAPLLEAQELPDRPFVEAAAPVLDKTHGYLDAIDAKGEALASLILDFVRHMHSRLDPQERSPQWNRLVEIVNGPRPSVEPVKEPPSKRS